MKEFKVFIASIVVFFVSWIAFSYLFAGTVVLVSGFSASLVDTLRENILICISFIGGILGAIFFGDNYHTHLTNG
jgi:hypothetical protein